MARPMAQLDDTDWRQLIPNGGVRREKLRNSQLSEKSTEEIALKSSLHCKGRPAKQVEEVTALRALAKITSFFPPASAEQLEVLHNEFHLATRRKNKDIADEISEYTGCAGTACILRVVQWGGAMCMHENATEHNRFSMAKRVNVLDLPDETVPVVQPEESLVFQEVASPLNEIEEDVEEVEGIYSAMEELADMIETGMDAESLDIDHGTVLAETPVHPEPTPEPVQAVNWRRERRPYSAEQREVLSSIWPSEGRIKTLQMK
eukprot:CAMPEP_0172157472 /NCGR_PEP_ID=MMETSP1050-20130122/3807_1 /TAXON_ID=233186 /ORGANISM="Cryptomonas curvata, Strain CCAP979/52" /LENGTH=261 /DNA_ID=CAMNT_0012826699 /DNA_START=237 /DNA_END=1025 /DNA_ORIENTATION=-